jgi:hypothetical protein
MWSMGRCYSHVLSLKAIVEHDDVVSATKDLKD